MTDLDFETRSEAGFFYDPERRKWHGPPRASQNKKGLPVIGSKVYAEHPSTDVLCLRYDLKDGAGSRHWRPGLPPPADLVAHILSGGLLEAWNAMFERLIWEHIMVPRYGAPPVPPAQWRCAMAKARAHALPGKLEDAGEVLALPVQKDKDGKRLIDKFSMPRNPTKADPRLWVPPQWGDPTHPDHADTLALDRYCAQDIAAEAALSAATPDLSPAELAYWQDDQAINHRGVAIDLDAMHACVAIIEQAEIRYGHELAALTGGIAPSEIKQLLGWLHGQGVHLDSLDEETVDDALTWVPVGPARRALEIRSAVGSASVKKVFAMRNQVSAAGRLHNLYTFYGARTGRPVGNGPQPTNLPKAGPNVHRCDHCGKWHGAHTMWCMWCHKMTVRKPGSAREWNPDAMEDAITAIGFRSLDYLELLFGDAMLTVAGVLRGLFVAAEGRKFVSSDFTAIEGVVIACLAGEQWRVDAFAQDRSLYVESASRAFGVPVEEMERHKKETGQHHHLRQVGKGLELACLGGDTEVLTDRGYVRIVDVTPGDRLWDGIEWVNHLGLVNKGMRHVVNLDGVEMTPNHLVRCNGFWKEAKALASSANTLSLALATGLASYSFYALSLQEADETRKSELHAPAANLPTECRLPASEPGQALGATLALSASQSKREKCFGSTRSTALTTNTAGVCSIGSPQPSEDATGRETRNTTTTEPAASTCGRSGGRTAAALFNMWSDCRAGTTRAWRWIAKTTTGATSQATFSSSPSETTCSTGALCPNCSSESLNWKPVYDIAHAGPRNRFTIRTNSGHLVVHNCGYGGWVGAVRAFGMDGTDEELKSNVLAWRDASPALVEFWGGQKGGPGARSRWGPRMFGLEGAAITAVQQPGEWQHVRRLDGTESGVSYIRHQDVLYCRLPSGGFITYHRPHLVQATEEWRGLSLSFEGWNTNPKSGPPGWIRMNTYSGKLAENVTQATARCIQMNAIRRCEASGRYPVVMHTYDEIVAEIPTGTGSVEELETLMCTPEPWHAGWPIKAAGGWTGRRYRKG